MDKASEHKPVKLIVGLIFNQAGVLSRAKTILRMRFGRADFESRILNFNYTDYYEKEFGRDLKRQFLSFKRLINPGDLAAIKLLTNRLELKLGYGPQKAGKIARRINIDPGYLELPKLVLATTKDFSHRIYLKKGIFAEVTLAYHKNSFKPLDWTYPDYRTPQYLSIFNHIRRLYYSQIYP
ncbi:MAG: DUF4416 family protein [Candidatus Omnitrophica bacterium]|nr:DUF4416 family protein [Candidatus Omnitrophota bacterium]MDD5654789.1 DUF4416 family protein [Candidatus Omnitrophota bacterium]